MENHFEWAGKLVLACALAVMPGFAGAQQDLWVAPGGHLQQLDRSNDRSVVVPARLASGVQRIAGGEVGVVVPLGAAPGEQRLEQSDQSVAALAGGGFAAIWTDLAATATQVRLQYVDASGVPLLANDGLVLDAVVNGYPQPAVIAHPDGGAVVAYRHDIGTNINQVILQWVDATGALRWGPAGQSAFGEPIAGRILGMPHLTAHTDGDFSVCVSHVAFSGDDQTTCQRLAPNGSPRWNALGVQAGGKPGWRPMPVTLAGEGGDLFVFWKLHPEDGTPIRIEGQRFAPSGERRWGALARTLRMANLASAGGQLSSEFRAITDGDGGAIVVFMDWDGAGSPSNDTIALRVRKDDALPWDDGIAVGSGSEGQQPGGAIPTGDGGAVIGFNEFPTEGSVVRTTLQRLSPGGVLMWHAPGFVLADAPGAMNYNVHGERVGDLLQIAWTRYLPPETGDFDARLTALTLGGEQVGPATGALMAGGPRWEFVRGYVRDARGGVGLAVMDSADFSGVDRGNTLGAMHTRSTDDLFADHFESVAGH
jgi:hypothetical protein